MRERVVNEFDFVRFAKTPVIQFLLRFSGSRLSCSSALGWLRLHDVANWLFGALTNDYANEKCSENTIYNMYKKKVANHFCLRLLMVTNNKNYCPLGMKEIL